MYWKSLSTWKGSAQNVPPASPSIYISQNAILCGNAVPQNHEVRRTVPVNIWSVACLGKGSNILLTDIHLTSLEDVCLATLS